MALSEELKRIYSSNPVAVRAYDTVELSHSLFTQTYYLVKDAQNHDWQLEDLSTVTFEAYGFNVVLPEAGSTQQDLKFQFDAVSGISVQELERAAENIEEPIRLIYRAYVDGYDTPQTTAIHLVLTNIVADAYTISAMATRPDLYSRTIPNGAKVFYDKRFLGLYL